MDINNQPKLNLINIEAEQAILGKIILDNRYYEKASEILKSYFFSEEAHKRIYTEIERLIVQEHKIADTITLSSFFKTDEFIKQINEHDYISILLSVGSSVVAIADYCNIVRDCYVRRELLNISNKINETLEKPIKSIDILNDLKNEITDLEDESADFTYSLVNVNDILKEKIEEIKQSDGENNDYIKTDIIDFDRVFGGIPRKNLTILAGRPSMGKTTLALQFAINIAKQNKNVIFFSQEMTNTENANKIISNLAKINSVKVRDKYINETELNNISNSIKDLINTKLFIDDKSKINSDYIRRTLRRFKRKYGKIDLIIVDHLQITGDSRKSKNRIEELGNITSDFKTIAKEENTAFLCLSQLSRAIEMKDNKRPELSDLRESGDIEQNADIVAFIYRAEYYLERTLQGMKESDRNYQTTKNLYENSKNKCEILVKKYRNGKCGNITLHFEPEFSYFRDLHEEELGYSTDYVKISYKNNGISHD